MIRFLVSKSGDDTFVGINAEDATEAAEKFVEKYEWERAEFPVGTRSSEMRVTVKTPSRRVYEFVVTGVPRPVYRADSV